MNFKKAKQIEIFFYNNFVNLVVYLKSAFGKQIMPQMSNHVALVSKMRSWPSFAYFENFQKLNMQTICYFASLWIEGSWGGGFCRRFIIDLVVRNFHWPFLECVFGFLKVSYLTRSLTTHAIRSGSLPIIYVFSV